MIQTTFIPSRDVSKLVNYSMKNKIVREIVNSRIYLAEIKGQGGY